MVSHTCQNSKEKAGYSSRLVKGAVKTEVWVWFLQALQASGYGMTGELCWWTSLRVGILSIERIQAKS